MIKCQNQTHELYIDDAATTAQRAYTSDLLIFTIRLSQYGLSDSWMDWSRSGMLKAWPHIHIKNTLSVRLNIKCIMHGWLSFISFPSVC